MAFEITASKRRPQRFSELAGQNFVVSTLMSSLKQKRIAHAYLFSGPRGVGKTSAARILAKSLNCESGISEEPCGNCTSCSEITAGNALDVIEIDGASNTSVNDIRSIKDEVLFPPNSSQYKIYIIDEVHMLSNSAFNALLKTIEEPPPYVIFIFATTEVHKVPATIRSRCQQFHFQLISLETIIEELQEACRQMDISYEEEALFWIAKEATGSLRDGYTLFDQIASFSDGHIRMGLIREKLGLLGTEAINTIAEHMVEGDKQGAVSAVHEILSRGVSVEKCIIDLAEYFRSLLLIKEGISKESVLSAHPEDFSPKVLEALSSEQIEAALDLLLELYRSIRYSLNERFELELAISRLSSLSHAVSPALLIKQIRELKQELLEPLPSHGSPRPARAPDKGPARTAGPPVKSTASTEMKPKDVPEQQQLKLSSKHFEILQAQLKQQSPALASTIGQITSWEVDGDTVILFFATRYTAGRAGEQLSLITSELRKILGRSLQVRVTAEEKKKEAAAEKPSEKKDDAIDMVTSIFRGEIIEQDKKGDTL